MITNENLLFSDLETIISNLEYKQAVKREVFAKKDLDPLQKVRLLEEKDISVVEEKNDWLDQQLELIKKINELKASTEQLQQQQIDLDQISKRFAMRALMAADDALVQYDLDRAAGLLNTVDDSVVSQTPNLKIVQDQLQKELDRFKKIERGAPILSNAFRQIISSLSQNQPIPIELKKTLAGSNSQELPTKTISRWLETDRYWRKQEDEADSEESLESLASKLSDFRQKVLLPNSKHEELFQIVTDIENLQLRKPNEQIFKSFSLEWGKRILKEVHQAEKLRHYLHQYANSSGSVSLDLTRTKEALRQIFVLIKGFSPLVIQRFEISGTPDLEQLKLYFDAQERGFIQGHIETLSSYRMSAEHGTVKPKKYRRLNQGEYTNE